VLTDNVVRATDGSPSWAAVPPGSVLPGKRYEDWNVGAGQPVYVVRKMCDDIQARVTTLPGEVADQS
jgi:hypothetical protein